jgi:hypothetical protein
MMEMSVASIRQLVDSDSDGPIEAHCRPAIGWLLDEVDRLNGRIDKLAGALTDEWAKHHERAEVLIDLFKETGT